MCSHKCVINMRNKKIVSAVGAIALTLGIGMNLQYSLDDYGIKTNTLSNFVWAQSGSSWGGGSTATTEYSTPRNVSVLCKIKITGSTSGGISAEISAGTGVVSGGVSGGASTGSSNETYMEFTAKMILCYPRENYVQTCTPFNPCILQ